MIEGFDIITYLEDREIEYRTSGKNVTSGWVNIECPFPQCSDPSWHCGINLESKGFHCWICGEKGSVKKLIRELEHCSWIRVDLIIGQFREDILDQPLPVERMIIEETDILPKNCSSDFPAIHKNYLRKRDFDPDFLIEKYKLKAVYNIGEYRFRIIIPVFLDGRLVTFVARDVIGNAELKYKNCPKERSIILVNHTLYNIDSVRDTAIIVEGVTDVWRIGNGAVATFTDNHTQEQVDLLTTKGVKNAYVMYDADALMKAKKLAGTLVGSIPHVEVIEMSEGDPADLSEEQVRELRKDIF